MKKIGIILLLSIISFCAISAKNKEINIDFRSGFSYWNKKLGLHVGAYVDFWQNQLFSFKTGVLFYDINKSHQADMSFAMPFYASLHLPISSNKNLYMDGGAYIGAGNGMNCGPTFDIGVKWDKLSVGTFVFLGLYAKQ